MKIKGRKPIHGFLGLLLICLLIMGSVAMASESKATKETEASKDEPSMRVTMIDVGQGSATLLACDGHYALVDGGGRESSDKVVAYLKEQKIQQLDTIIATHYDEDHISGLIGVCHVFDVGTCICPFYQADTKIYQSFMDILRSKQIQVIYPSKDTEVTLGEAKLRVMIPLSWENEKENNLSLCIRAVCGDFSCLITGDAEKEEEADLLTQTQEIKSTVYMAGHHGSKSSADEAFLQAVAPEVVCISCGAGNAFGHPDQELLTELQKMHCDMYRSDLQGDVTLTYAQGKVTCDAKPCEDWTQGVAVAESETKDTEVKETKAETEVTADYVCNISSHKFHRPTCDSVNKMKAKNKLSVNCSREELIQQGYAPCKNCNP